MAHSVRLWLQTQSYWARIPAGEGAVHTVIQTVQRPGVCGAVYGAEHYKEQLKSFDNIPSRYCHDCAESDVKQ